MNLLKSILIFKFLFYKILISLAFNTNVLAQVDETVSTVVIDSAPKKLYSELYLDEAGNQFLVEIYEEPQEGENLIHFRTFKNGEIIGRKSQALADSHNFTFFIDESEERIMRKDTEQMLYNVLKKLMEESDNKLKSKLEDIFDQEKMAKSLSEKIKTPERQIRNMAQKISEQMKDDENISDMASRISEQMKDDENISDMATRISKQIKTPEEQISAMASRISKEIKTPDEQIENIAERISKQIKTPEEQISAMANQISEKITFDGGTISDMATRISKEIKTPEEQISSMANKISEKITFDGGTISDMATRISKQIKTPEDQISSMAKRISKEIKTPDEQISNMAEQISQQIKTPEARVNEDNLALTLAIKLTQDENLVATKIPPYQELLSQVSASNEQQDYEKTIKILDEDIADRTPDEQRRALKISGLMSVLVASKKLKRAISTIEDYDLPDDPALREISSALSEWLANNIVSE
tara:strand:+ start:75 stop:1502 length:1428 start_codon:yes stop_codon:yes gene_type:complete